MISTTGLLYDPELEVLCTLTREPYSVNVADLAADFKAPRGRIIGWIKNLRSQGFGVSMKNRGDELAAFVPREFWSMVVRRCLTYWRARYET